MIRSVTEAQIVRGIMPRSKLSLIRVLFAIKFKSKKGF